MRRTIVVALTGLVLASCGGTEARLTRAEMVSRVLAACTTARQATEREMRTSKGAVRARVVAGLVAGQRVLIDRLDGLNPPAAAKHDFDTFRQDLQRRLELYEEVQAAGPSGIARALAANRREQREIFIRLDAVNHKYSLTGCV